MKTVCLYFEIHQNIHLKRYRFSTSVPTIIITMTTKMHAQLLKQPNAHTFLHLKRSSKWLKPIRANSNVPFHFQVVPLNSWKIMLRKSLNYSKCSIKPAVLNFLPNLTRMDSLHWKRGNIPRWSYPFVQKVKTLFNQEPKIFRNSCLVYSDDIGEMVASMGFKGMLAEGAKHVLGWKSPHFVYSCSRDPRLKLLLRDYSLSEDISYRFNDSSWSEYPLFADTYANWISNLPEEDQVINIFMELCAIGISSRCLQTSLNSWKHFLLNSRKEVLPSALLQKFAAK